MNCKWLVEDIFPEDSQQLFDAFKALGIDYKTTDRIRSFNAIGQEFRPPAAYPVVFYGSLDSAKLYQRESNYIPGVYFKQKAYYCNNYYPYYGSYLLNSNYIMLPYGELRRQKEFLYDKLGQERTIFIRPNSGNKIFTGTLVYKEHFDKDITRMGFYDVDPSELCVVAEPINIQAEWRFVIVKNKVVDGSLYKENNIVGSVHTYPQEAYLLASKLCKYYNPDIAYCMDICRTNGGNYKLLEIGCFSCCGLYACDRKKVVEAVSIAAEEEHEAYNS